MTWVVGGAHLFCARCISDVQVTVPMSDGSTRFFDAVKKVHPIGPGLVVAFAGSIRMAFALVEGLTNDFYPRLDPRRFEAPSEVMRQMQRWLKYHYEKQQRSEDVEFLILAAPLGLWTGFGVWKVRSPEFNIVEPSKGFGMLQIGSGSSITDYARIMERHSVSGYEISRGPGEKPYLLILAGKIALRYAFEEALEYRNAGISRPMHITLLTHQHCVTDELPEDPHAPFPRVATSWNELRQLVLARGVDLGDGLALA